MKWTIDEWWADESILKGAMTNLMKKKKARGRPRKRWKDSVQELSIIYTNCH